MNSRLFKILKSIMQSDVVTNGSYLSKITNVSARTIQKDIKLLNDILKQYGACIHSIRSVGYKLEIKNPETFYLFIKEEEKQQGVETDVPGDTEERVLFLLRRLLLAEDYLKQEDLADEMYVSKSTIQKLMKDVREKLAVYKLTLPSKSSFGLKVEGNEFYFRSCISEYCFFRDINNSFMAKETFFEEFFIEKQIDDLQILLLNAVDNESIYISDRDFEDVLIHFLVAIKRIKVGLYIRKEEIKSREIPKALTSTVVIDILKEMESIFNVTIPESERIYLCLFLLGKKIIPNELNNDNHSIPEVHKVIDDMLDAVFMEMHIDLREDSDLRTSLFNHLKVMFNRLEYGLHIRNPILKEIKEKYPLSFEMALIAAESLKKSLKIEINDEEKGFLAIHLEGAIQRMNANITPIRCIVVCSTGTGSAQLLKYGLNKRLGDQLKIMGVQSYYALPQMDMEKIGLIISTIQLDPALTIPFIKVSPILSEQDIMTIKHKMKTIQTKNQAQIAQFIKEDLIFLEMEFSSPEEVIESICQTIINKELASLDITELVIERERASPTSYGNFIAIPHPLKNVSYETFLAFCTLKKPIKWGNEMVQLICFFNIKKNNEIDLQHLYEFLYTMINDKKMVEQLTKCHTVLEFVDLLYSEDKNKKIHIIK
ncbi:BglG family transcription antiterminator [Peribacillus muralis]|uniref:BglG family transcription antiterminator n=1 Tax=Peribacillus muralis TaxID=264697 RepID=UPI0036710707